MKTLILNSRFVIGVLGFVGMAVGIGSFAQNHNPWALLIGLSSAALTVWGGAFEEQS